jgi:NodT family efflux transporter outer membrane factor (OMF) lipoprotein
MSARSSAAAARQCGLLCAVALLGACAVGPRFHRPATPAVTHYTPGSDPAQTVAAEGVAQSLQLGEAVRADWWTLFHSEPLDRIVAAALARNPGLAAAQANLRASQDALRSGYGVFYPQIGADGAAKRERLSPAALGEGSGGNVFNLFTLSASVSYALDLFGGQRRLIEGLHAQADVAAANERAAALAVSANVVNAVIARSAYAAEIDAGGRLVAMQEEQLRLAEVQERAGTTARANVLAIAAQLEAARAALPPLRQRLAAADDLLATLAGYAPSEGPLPAVALSDLQLPPDLPLSLPSALLEQRPDVLAAEAAAHAASANVGVTTAAMLPSVTLSGLLGSESNATGKLLKRGAGVWSVGADVAMPVFQGGSLWYKRRAAVENYHAAAALYRQVVLAAFEQVADTLHALEQDANRLAALERSRRDADEALRLRQANYSAGLANYLDLIVADSADRTAEIAEIDGIAQRLQDSVALLAAVGGGWWNPAPPR